MGSQTERVSYSHTHAPSCLRTSGPQTRGSSESVAENPPPSYCLSPVCFVLVVMGGDTIGEAAKTSLYQNTVVVLAWCFSFGNIHVMFWMCKKPGLSGHNLRLHGFMAFSQ